jgi:hypothetical protein
VAITIRLRTEFQGTVTVADPNGGTFDWTDDIDRLIPFGDPTFRCLGVIDRYGDTVFNQLQIPYLLEDLARLDRSSATEAEEEGLRRLEVLARACLDDIHVYLWFIGD